MRVYPPHLNDKVIQSGTRMCRVGVFTTPPGEIPYLIIAVIQPSSLRYRFEYTLIATLLQAKRLWWYIAKDMPP